MSVLEAVKNYVKRFIDQPGMKAILLDEETTGIVSMVMGQSEIISKECYLIERVDVQTRGEPKHPNMHHMKAMAFVRPTSKSIAFLKEQLKKPKYKEFHLFFSNILREDQLKQLAEADEFEVVKQVQLLFMDYYAINSDLFTLNLPESIPMYQAEAYWQQKDRKQFRRTVEGVLGVLLSLKKRPKIRFKVRHALALIGVSSYDKSSDLAKRLAFEVEHRIQEEAGLFHFARPVKGEPLLLIVDRREDPITPLLQQWTYQAMVHELLGLTNNRVDLSKVESRKELREIVLSEETDRFFKGSRFLSYGDLGAQIKGAVEDFKREVKSNQNIASIEDMQRFVENYPQFRSMQSSVSKHVALLSELSRQVEVRNLMEVSGLEQDMACSQAHSEHLDRVLKMVNDPRIKHEDKLRLVLIYALRYEKQKNQLGTLQGMLRDQAANHAELRRTRAVSALLKHAGARTRGGDLFGNKSFMKRAQKFFSSGLKDVENIFTQHRPVLAETLDQLFRGKLKTSTFPFVDETEKITLSDVVVFIVGGTTYEEAALVASLNQNDSGPRVILGGSYIHNSNSFLNDVLSGVRDFVDEKSEFDLR